MKSIKEKLEKKSKCGILVLDNDPQTWDELNRKYELYENNDFISLSDAVAIAEEAIEEKWISIEKSLPELGEKVIVNLDNGFVTLIGRLNTNGWSAFFVDGEKLCQIATVSHWMPLPSFPDQSKEENKQ